MTEPYALGTFSRGGQTPWPGVVRGGRVIPLATLHPAAPADLADVFGNWSDWGDAVHEAVLASDGDGWTDQGDLTIHSPYIPDNLFGAGANYRRHVIELIIDKGAGGLAHLDHDARRKFGEELMDQRAATGKPFVWIGLRSAIADLTQPLVLPFDVTEPDWELELAVVIGKAGRRIPREKALDHVAGYTIANDITARELVDRPDIPQLGMDLLASKNAPGFHVVGPFITPARLVPDPQQLRLTLALNGKVMQDDSTDDMIFSVARLIEGISANVQLHPGDVIMTGSPAGNGTHYNRFLRDGDVMTGSIEGLVGQQVTRCIAEHNPN